MSTQLLLTALESLQKGEIHSTRTGICNNIYEMIKAEHGVVSAFQSRDLLKETFLKMGLSEKYPVEYSFFPQEEKAKDEYYEDMRKWSPKSKYGKRRIELIDELITFLQ